MKYYRESRAKCTPYVQETEGRLTGLVTSHVGNCLKQVTEGKILGWKGWEGMEEDVSSYGMTLK
jgi:hypothetical protein